MGGSARGWSKRGKEEEDGGRAFLRPAEREDLPANRVKHCATQAPVRVSGCARGQRDGEKKREEERQA